MEEPVCEPPAVGLYYVTKLASAHVKVLLSGEGGDEAFAGYQNYRNMLWLERLRVVGQPWTDLAAGVFSSFGHVSGLQQTSEVFPNAEGALGRLLLRPHRKPVELLQPQQRNDLLLD